MSSSVAVPISSVSSAANGRPSRCTNRWPELVFPDIGPVLDEQAKTAYRAQLRELEDDLAEATSWADPVRAARARQEMQFLTDELAAAVGLGGRARKPGSPAERARVNITRALRGALSRIREHSPALAGHLDATVHTGTFCGYTPDPRAPITWHT
jgi:hypothetical protein